jgi:hypothetical protein
MTDADLATAEQLARRLGPVNCWTGTGGSLASFALAMIREQREQNMGDDMTPAEGLLDTAQKTVRQRRNTYGPPGEHFAKTVAAVNAIFSAKLREPLTVGDWAQIMIIDKLARHQGAARSADTPVDLAGYAACLAEVEAPGEPSGNPG